VAIAVGIWIAFAGAVALLVGMSARHRVRRLKRDGVKVWGEAVQRPLPDGEQRGSRQYDSGQYGGGHGGGGHGSGGHGSGGHGSGGQRVTLQYTLTDGRVLERSAKARRTAPLAPGQKVLIWYDPEDPADVLVYGRDGRASDMTFIVIGLIFLVIGVVIAVFAP
jgi:hypothetical protein